MSQSKTDSNSHIIQLDGVRFFAILMVLIAHWLQSQTNKPIFKAFPFVEGVTLFFVLSGFLITDILVRNKMKYEQLRISNLPLIKAFYIRRALRIFPVYFLTIFFLFLMSYKNTREIFPWLITFTSNIYQSIHNTYVGDFNHFWSLAVEEQFYLFWPWLIIIIPTRFSEKLIIGLIGLSIITKAYLFVYYPDKWMANSYFTLSCMYALGIGALIAYWSIYRKNILVYFSKFSWVCGSVIVCIFIHYLVYFNKVSWVNEIVNNLLFSLMSGIIINYAAQNKFKGWMKSILENRFVVYSGKISYGLYVFHLFVPSFFCNYLSGKLGLTVTNKYTAFVFFYLTTFVLAHMSWRFIESPINNLKKYFPYLKESKEMLNKEEESFTL